MQLRVSTLEPQAPPPPETAAPQGQAWFKDARTRLGLLADELGTKAPQGGAAPEAASCLIDLISTVPDRKEAAESFEGPEAMIAYAAARGLEATRAFQAPSALTSADFPVLVLVQGGDARLLLGREGDSFEGIGTLGSYRITLAQLKAEAGGLLLHLRPAGESHTAQADVDEDPVQTAIRFVRERQGWMLVRLMVAAGISNLLLLALPIYSGLVFDRVIPHAALDTLWAISLGVFLALGADLALRFVRLKIQDAISCRASAALQAGIMRRLLSTQIVRAPRAAGALSIRLREIEQLAQITPALIVSVAVDAPFLALVFLLIWFNGGPVVAAPVLGILALVGLHHLTHRASLEPQTRAARLAQKQTNRVIETVDGLETIKASRMERATLGRFEGTYAEYAFASHLGRFWHGFAGYASTVVGQAMIVLVTLIGVYQVTTGTMTIGALTTCTLLVSRIIAPVGQLVSLLHRARQIRDTLKALSLTGRDTLESPGDPTGARAAPVSGEIRLDSVSFTYPGQSSPQVEGISLTIRPGEKVAIIGRSGSGKSTLLRLMMRLYEPTAGAVLIDGMDARQYEPHALRGALGYLGQNPGLMDDTLLANLTFGVRAPDIAEVDRIATLAGVKDIVARHPLGFGLPVGPRGEALSGGERQAVALGRTLLSSAKVFILDEPTAAMDTVLEARLARDLKTELADRTVVLATHRAPMLDLVDRLIWIERGRLIADGPKDEVLRRLKGAA